MFLSHRLTVAYKYSARKSSHGTSLYTTFHANAPHIFGALPDKGHICTYLFAAQRTYLVVVLLDDHLKVETGELAQVAVGPRLLRPKHWPNLPAPRNDIVVNSSTMNGKTTPSRP